MECFKLLFDLLAWIEHQFFWWHKRFMEGRESLRDDEWCGRSKKVRTPELICQRVRGRLRVTMLRFWGSSGRDSVGRGQDSSNRVSGISTRIIYQSTTPSFSQTTKMGIKTVPRPPYSSDVAPSDFCLFPNFKENLRDNWGDERGCDEGHWHARPRRLPLGLSESVGTVQQVHCSRRRFLRRGIEFHVCAINKSAHTKKRLETYWRHRVYDF